MNLPSDITGSSTERRPPRDWLPSSNEIDHLLRRSGFGAGPDERAAFAGLSYDHAVSRLVEYGSLPDDVDDLIGRTDRVGIALHSGLFTPNTLITDARQRWLFRMVHTGRPLQEKMALFWHNHFATGYSKIAGLYGGTEATRMMAAKRAEDPGGVRGQIELFRDMALGNFRDLLIAVAQDPAMLVWLDGRLNVKAKPQENFAREVMELFTLGVGFYTEQDVYSAARVFSGWNLQRIGASTDPAGRYQFVYNAAQHETSAKTFSFPVYADGSNTIPARAESVGLQDGLDFLDGLARHPETANRLARKLWAFFVSEMSDADPAFVKDISGAYLRNNFDIKAVMRSVLMSQAFLAKSAEFARYAWPVELVAKSIKEMGWSGFSVNDALTPLSNMGQQLYDPPSVAGWALGRSWFSSVTMLMRANFTAALAKSQKAPLASDAKSWSRSPGAMLLWGLKRLSAAGLDTPEADALLSYLKGPDAWTGTDTQLQIKAPALIHLMASSAEYQFV